MGCPLGSFAFAITKQDIYEAGLSMISDRIKSRLPPDQPFLNRTFVVPQIEAGNNPVFCPVPSSLTLPVNRALTDDNLISFFPTEEDPSVLFDDVLAYHKFMKVNLAKINLRLASDKSELLLPTGFIDFKDCPVLEEITVIHPDGDLISSRGIRIAGVPVGPDGYVRDFVDSSLHNYSSKLSALEGIDPQTGFALLRSCIAPSPIFLAQTVVPHLVFDLYCRFDRSVSN